MKIRVLEVLATLKRAGAENVAVTLACGLDRSRFEAGVVSLYDPHPDGLEPLLEECHIPVWHLGKRRGFDPRVYPRLIGLFRDYKPGVVHTHSYVLRYVLPAAQVARVKALVHTVHNLAEKEVDAVGRAIQRIAFRRRVVAVAVGGEVARSFKALYGFAPAATIPNGIDTARFLRPDAPERWRRAHGFSPDDVLVVSVARLEPQKNPLGLVECFSLACGDHPRCHLLIAGDGSLLAAARDRASSLGISGRVHFLGVRPDVPELLSASDIFALASLWEGRPLSVMEAMAAGLPVVAASVGGVPELVEDGITGILAPPGDTPALSSALAALVRDEHRRRQLGRAAGERAKLFDASRMVARYAELFERVEASP